MSLLRSKWGGRIWLSGFKMCPEAPRQASSRLKSTMETSVKSTSLWFFSNPGKRRHVLRGDIENDQEYFYRLSRPVAAGAHESNLWRVQEPLKILVLSKSKNCWVKSRSTNPPKRVQWTLTFTEILSEAVNHVAINKNYHRSDLLQTLRNIKTYELVRSVQLEIFGDPLPRKDSR